MLHQTLYVYMYVCIYIYIIPNLYNLTKVAILSSYFMYEKTKSQTG